MYDEQQHKDLFLGPGMYLFRGTLPASFYEGEKSSGVTPTTVDPIVATLFACRYRTEGPARVLIALKQDFADDLNGPNLASYEYELAVNLEMSQQTFEHRSRFNISVDESLSILRTLGYELPVQLYDHLALSQALQQSPRMLLTQVAAYANACAKH